MPEFPTNGPVDASIRLGSGSIHLVAEPRTTAEVVIEPEHNSEASRAVADATRVQMIGNSLSIEVPSTKGFGFMRRGGSLRISVRLPLDSRIAVESASADTTMVGRFGTTTVNSASGDLRIEQIAGDLARDSASGDSDVRHVTGDVRVKSASGDLRIGGVDGDLRLRTASGDVVVDAVGGSMNLTSASGDIRIGSIHTGETSIKSASGDVEVGVAEGTSVWLDVNTLSGDTRSELEMTGVQPVGQPTMLKLGIQTTSGDVRIRRAAPLPVGPTDPVPAGGIPSDDVPSDALDTD